MFKDSVLTLSTGTRQMSLHPVDAVGTCSIISHLSPKTKKSPHVHTKVKCQACYTRRNEVKRKQETNGDSHAPRHNCPSLSVSDAAIMAGRALMRLCKADARHDAIAPQLSGRTNNGAKWLTNDGACTESVVLSSRNEWGGFEECVEACGHMPLSRHFATCSLTPLRDTSNMFRVAFFLGLCFKNKKRRV